MSLIVLPPELRLQIYALLPEFRSSPHASIRVTSSSTQIPALCRTSRLLRQETLPLYAQSATFAIELTAGLDPQRLVSQELHGWLNALGPYGLARLSRLNFSRHWELSRPSRGQHHVGFYVFLVRDLAGLGAQASRRWQMNVGTYPIVKDLSGMRLQSVQLLERSVIARLQREDALADASRELKLTAEVHGQQDFTRADFEYVIAAMDVIARHPFSTFEPQEEAKQRQLVAFEKMREELAAL
nr:hypothetical protein B0A51_14367 [Rachicladosporium sp. CCFEE 5018]